MFRVSVYSYLCCSRARAALAVAALLAAAPPSRASESSLPIAPGRQVTCRSVRGDGDALVFAQRLMSTGAIDGAWDPAASGLCVGAGIQSSVGVVSDGAGGAFVSWIEANGAGSNVRLQRLDASGAKAAGWPDAGLLLCGAGGDQYGARLVADGAGGAIACWQDYRAGQGDVYATRVTATGAIADGWSANGTAVCADNAEQAGVALATDGSGGAYVAWQDYSGGSSRLRLVRLASDATRHDIVAALGDPAESQTGIQIVADGLGGVFVTWEGRAEAAAAVIRAQRLAPDGAPATGWPAGGLALAASAGEQRFPASVLATGGGLLVAWLQHEESRGVVRVQAMNADGTRRVGWPADGVRVSASTSEQYAPALLADAAGGAAVAWEEYRDGVGSDIYAQRLAPDGTAQWGAAGALVCDDAGDQQSPALFANGSGFIASWTDASLSGRGAWTPGGTLPVVSLARTTIEGGAVHLEWTTASRVDAARLYRRTTEGAWQLVSSARLDSDLRLTAEDATGYGAGPLQYRLRVSRGLYEWDLPEFTLDPSTLLALALEGAHPNPARGLLRVAFTLPQAAPARLELLDVAGRRVAERAVGELGPGHHLVEFPEARHVPAGRYVLRLTQGSRSLTTTVTTLR